MDRVWASAILSECQEIGAAKPCGLAVTSDAAIGRLDLTQTLSMVTDSLSSIFARCVNHFGSGSIPAPPVQPNAGSALPQCWRKAGDACRYHSIAIVLAKLGWIA